MSGRTATTVAAPKKYRRFGQAPEEKIKASSKLHKSSKDSASAFAIIEAVFAALQMIALVVLVGFLFVQPSSPAQIRSAPLLVPAFFSIVIVSVYIDQDLFDYYSAFVFGFLSLAVLIPFGIKEYARWAVCDGVSSVSQTPIENFIDTDYHTQCPLVPVVGLFAIFFTLTMTVLLFFWFSRHRMKILAADTATKAMNKKSATARHQETLKAAWKHATNNWPRYVCLVTCVGQMIILFAIIIPLQLSFTDSAAFYRATFFIPVAFAAACEYAFFYRTPTWWTWITLGFNIFALFSLVYGMIEEFARWHRCNEGTPLGVVENYICTNNPILGGFVPWTLFASLILMIISTAMLITMLCKGTDHYKPASASAPAKTAEETASSSAEEEEASEET